MESYYIILIISIIINLIISVFIAKWSTRVQLDFLKVFLISFLLSPLVGMFYVMINKKELVDLSTKTQGVINSYIRKIGYFLALLIILFIAIYIKDSIEEHDRSIMLIEENDLYLYNQHRYLDSVEKSQDRYHDSVEKSQRYLDSVEKSQRYLDSAEKSRHRYLDSVEKSRHFPNTIR